MSEKPEKTEPWDGVGRRYCDAHCYISEATKKAVPWRVYVLSMSAMLMVAISYTGINETRMAGLKITTEKNAREYEAHLTGKIADARLKYSEDIERFISAIRENRAVITGLGLTINKLDVRMGRTEAKQDLVLERIKLTQP